MDESKRVIALSHRIAEAISRKDVETLAAMLDPRFLHRTPGGAQQDAREFLRAIEEIPAEILFVKLDRLEVDVAESGAVATGIQHARVRLDGKEIDDRRAFVDWFVRHGEEWRLRVAVDLPAA